MSPLPFGSESWNRLKNAFDLNQTLQNRKNHDEVSLTNALNAADAASDTNHLPTSSPKTPVLNIKEVATRTSRIPNNIKPNHTCSGFFMIKVE